MTQYLVPICLHCTHLKRDKRATALTCDAFPGGIPEGIFTSAEDHRNPIDGDNGIQFDPVDKDGADYAEELFNGRE